LVSLTILRVSALTQEKNTEDCFNIGQELSRNGSMDEAIELNPQYSMAGTDKGTVFQAQNKSEKALEAYDRAIDLSPANAETGKGWRRPQTATGLAASAISSMYVTRVLSSNIWQPFLEGV